MTPLPSEELDRLARRRANAKIGWYIHATVFVLVNALLFANSRHMFGIGGWSLFPLLGWGIGLAIHGIAVFVLGSGSRVRSRMVQRERERLQQEQEGAKRW